jgi:hypothetical protein
LQHRWNQISGDLKDKYSRAMGGKWKLRIIKLSSKSTEIRVGAGREEARNRP